jgi:hypothetical protein
MKRVSLGLSAAVLVAAGVLWFRLFGSYREWAAPLHWLGAAGIVAFALAVLAFATRRAWAGIAIAVSLQTIHLAIVALALAGVRLTRVVMFPDVRIAIVVSVITALAIWGLVRRRVWGRWLALALGAVGVVSGGLNIINYWSATAAPLADFPEWSQEMYETAWLLALTSLGGALIVACLAAPVVRDAFAARAHATWSSRDRLIGLLRATIIAAFAAGPMLLVYAWLQPIVPETQTTAVVLAAALGLGGVLAVRGKLAGALVLVIAGAGLLAQTAVTALDAPPDQHGIAAYYAVFWLPAGVLAVICGVKLAGPTLRLLRR